MPDILHRIGISAPPQKIYDALTQSSGLSSWWTTEVKAEAFVGAVLEFRFGSRGPDMEVLELVSAKRVAWLCKAGPEEWKGTKITFDIRASDQESVLLFRHREWREVSDFFAHCNTKWAVFLLSLKAFVEKGQGSPFPQDQKLSLWG